MPYIELELPPGLYRNGTEFQSRNRWYEGNLVRWYQGAMQPVGGWAEVSFTGNDIVQNESGTAGFGDYTVDTAPDDWTEYQLEGAVTNSVSGDTQDWVVVADVNSPSGQSLYLEDTNQAYLGVITWDDVTDFADGEALALVRMPGTGSKTGIAARFAGTPNPDVDTLGGLTRGIFGYVLNIGGSGYVYLASQDGYNAASYNNIPTDSGGGGWFASGVNKGFSEGEYIWLRFNFNGTAVKIRAWENGTSEPGAWDIDTTLGDPLGTGAITEAGGLGIISSCGTVARPQYASVVAFTSEAGGTAVDTGSGTSTVTPAATDIGGAALGSLGWRDNDNVPWLALGTPTKCWIYSEGLISDVTPGGFTTGLADGSTSIAGYGTGAYSAGLYGTGVSDSVGTVLEAQSWQFDTFGQVLVAQAHSDGSLWSFTPNTDTALQAIANAPTECKGVVVTPERFLVALGASGDPRNVVWADQESLTTWTATPENQAGDQVLTGNGTIMCGSRAQRETLIWTTEDMWTMQFIGGTLVYSFERPGTNCGVIGRRAYAMIDGSRAMWMGRDSFYLYDGRVTALPSEVGDDVFNDIQIDQASKIFAVVFQEFSEVWFFYPSSGSTNVDKYVAYNYAEGHWSMGSLARTAGISRGAFSYPMFTDRNGKLYDHERGDTYLDLDGVTALTPYAETGPIDIAQGDQTMWVRYIIPDENTLGDTRAYLKSRLYPTATETSFGPFSMAEPTSTRMSGRQVTLRVEQVNPGWRVGVPRLEVVPAGKR